MKDYTKRGSAKHLVGKTVRFEYGVPAVSCCANGGVVRGEGRVSRVRHNPTPHFGVNTLVVAEDGYDDIYVRVSEIVAVRDGKSRWRPVRIGGGA